DADSLLTGVGPFVISRSPSSGIPTGTSCGVVSTTQASNEFGELVGFECIAPTGSLYGVTLARDALGRVTTKGESVFGVHEVYAYGYDLAGNLIAVTRNGVLAESYSYDSNQNRLTATVEGATVAGTYDSVDRLLQYGGASWSYNEAGDMLAKNVA